MYRYSFVFALSLFVFSSAYCQNGTYRVKTVTGDTAGYRNGPDSVALFNSPTGIAADTTGNLYVADTYNNVIRKISITDSVFTLAGKDSAGYRNGVDSIAEFNEPQGVCVDKNGNVYIADTYNNVIRKISGGMVTTYAGDGRVGYRDGQADSAEFYFPTGVAADTSGNIYVTDNGNFSVREISNTGVVSTIAGTGYAGFKNGNGDTAQFDGLYGIAVNQNASQIYVTEYINNDVRMIQNGVVSVLAGNDTLITSIGYINGSLNGALFNDPTGIMTNDAGSVFVSDEYNNVIRDITTFVSTLAGNDTAGSRDTLDYLSEFNRPFGITRTHGSMYIVDNGNNRIRKITPLVPLGIASINTKKENGMLVYPNPCTDKLIVASAPLGKAEMLDVTGRLVWSTNYMKAPYVISTEGLSPGVYFLTVSDNSTTATKKIVIER